MKWLRKTSIKGLWKRSFINEDQKRQKVLVFWVIPPR